MFDFIKKNKTENKKIKYNKKLNNNLNVDMDINLDVDIEKLIKNDFDLDKDYFENEEIILSHSKNLSYDFLNQIQNINVTKLKFPEKEFDVVIAGGGLKCFYNIGAFEVLKKMMELNQINVRYFTGVSSGAYVSLFTILNIPVKNVRNMYEFARKNKHRHDLNKIFSKICEHILPSNVHELSNGKLRILVSKFTLKGLRPVIIDKFESKEHLIKILHATSFIPFLTTSEFNGVKIGGEQYFDGAFTNNTPIIYENDLPQLIFNTPSVNYSNSYAFKIIDSNPEKLIVTGAIDMEKFIKLINSDNLDNLDNLTNKEIKLFPIKWIPSKTFGKSNKSLDFMVDTLINLLIVVTLIYGYLINIINNFIPKRIKNFLLKNK